MVTRMQGLRDARSRPAARWLPWLLLSLLCLPAAAAEKRGRLAVLELETPPTMIGLGGQVQQQILTSAAQLGYEVISPEQLQERLGPQGYDELRKCGGRMACV